MTFLPVVERELRVASRRRNTYWTRFAAALIGIGVCAWIWIFTSDNLSQTDRSRNLFSCIAFVAFCYCILAGVFVTADSLSEEKREGTLGLLFLTDLKGYDVVLGKLVATSLNAFYRLLAFLPILAIPLILGGLTAGEFWRMALVLSNTLFFSLASGIFLSALSRNDRKAMVGTFSLILLASGAPPFMGLILAARKGMKYFNDGFLIPSPGYAYYLSFESEFLKAANQFWSSVAISHILAWGFIIVAGILARYSWQDKPLGGRKLIWRERMQRWQFGDMVARIRYRTRLLDVNPFFWLASRNRLKPHYVYLWLGIVGFVWLWLYIKYRSEMLDPAAYVPTAILLHTVLKLWLASEACRPLSEDRANGALELLLSTPMSVDEILQGQILALKRQFGGPVAVVLLADFAMFLAGNRNHLLTDPNDWLMLFLTGVLVLVADLYTLAWVGMWLGLTSKKTTRATQGTVARVLVFPWLVFLGFITVTMLVRVWQTSNPENMMLGAWFLIAILTDLFFFTWARTNLRNEFRTVVTQRFDSKTSRSFWSKKESVPQTVGDPANASG